MSSNIIVIGAGELGMAVLKSLAIHRGKGTASVTALLRHSSIERPSNVKQAELDHLQTLGIGLLGADIETATQGDLTHIFANYDTVISCSGMAGSAGLQIKLAKAAIDANVSRFVPWQYGVDYDTIGRNSAQDLFTEQLDVRDILRGQAAMQWLVFTVGVFMSFIFVPDFGMVDLDQQTVRAFGSWENQLTATTVQDIGRVVAETVFGGGDLWIRSPNNVVFVSGDTLTYDQLASSIDQALGKPMRRELWTLDLMKRRLEADPKNGFKKYGVIWAEACGVAWQKEHTFNALHGMDLTTVADYAQKYAS